MGWTTPKTWAFQEGVESAELNTHLRDNLNAIGGPIVRLRKPADQSVANTTLTNDTTFTFSIAASEVWGVELHAATSIDGNSDWKHHWSVPSGATGHHWWLGAPGPEFNRQDLATDGVIGKSSTTFTGLDFYATIVNSTTPGSVTFQFALFTAAGGSSTVYANALMIAYRISP
jgi:hypothetical protein